MVMLNKVVVNSIDVTSYRLSWVVDSEWDISIDSATVIFSPSVKSLLTLEVGQDIQISRGFITSTDDTIFDGQITQIKPQANQIVLVCKGRMYDSVKSAQVKSWDMNIDTEAGVGSEIFKSICDNSKLSYDDTSIVSTGTALANKVVKFIQNDEDDFQKMNELAERYNYMIMYDYNAGLVNFRPKGYTIYSPTLNVGVEIPGQIQWKENMEQLINKVKILGATVYDKVIESQAGPATEFVLSKTPEDTEVRINHATTDDLQTRGQKDIGTVGVDFDYYVDVENKKVIFSSAVSDFWINYGAQVPLPITVTNATSIAKYGGPNKVPHFKKVSLTDIKDAKDAEDRGRALINKYSVPFLEAEKIPVKDSVIQTYGVIKPGYVVNIVDEYNEKDVNVFVNSVTKSWPHVYDVITVGDEIWKTEDWQAAQMKKINQLFNELNKNQDILIQTFDNQRTIDYQRRYTLVQKRDIATAGTDIFILAHPTFGVLGTQKLGDTSGIELADYCLLQGKNTYKEYVYDTLFQEDLTPIAYYKLEPSAENNLLDDISAYYKFDGDATDSFGSYDGSVTGATITTGLIGQCYLFNGTTDEITTSVDIVTGGSTTWSVSLWINSSDLTGNREIVREWDSNFRYRLYASGTTLTARFRTGSATNIDLTTTITTGTWYHIVMIWDGSLAKLYVNNSLVDSDTMTSAATGSGHNLVIGSTGIGNYYAGSIDELGIWNGDITSYVDTLYNSGAGKSFDDFRGSLYDSSGNGNNGTNNGTTSSTGIINQGISTNGVDTYIEIENLFLNGLSSGLTIAGWIYYNAGTSYRAWLSNWNASDQNCVVLFNNRIPYCTLWMSDGSTAGAQFTTGTIPTATWTHVAFVWDGVADVSLYVNGVFQQTKTGSATGTPVLRDTTQKIWLGAQSGFSRYLNAITDEFGIYNRQLSTSELLELYSSGTGSRPSLTYNWDTVNDRIYLLAGDTFRTKYFTYGVTYSYFTLSTGTVSGSYVIQISGDGGTTWQTVTEDVRTAFSVKDSTGVKLKITAVTDTTISTTKNEQGQKTYPAINCKLEV